MPKLQRICNYSIIKHPIDKKVDLTHVMRMTNVEFKTMELRIKLGFEAFNIQKAKNDDVRFLANCTCL